MKIDPSHPALITRRDFLGRFACSTIASSSLLGTLGALRLMQNSAMAQTAYPDYKAIICLFLFGGNDSNNLLIPMADGGVKPAYTNYIAARPNGAANKLGLADQALPLTAPTAGFGQANADNFGVHPAMGNLQGIFNSTLQANRDLAFVANVGPLIKPLTQQQYKEAVMPRPQSLFSHADQQYQWMRNFPLYDTGVYIQPLGTGWGGRIGDYYLDPANSGLINNPAVSMNVSVAGQNFFQAGDSSFQYGITTNGVVDLTYGHTEDGMGPIDLMSKLSPTYANRLERSYNNRVVSAFTAGSEFKAVLARSDEGASAVIEGAFGDIFQQAEQPSLAAQLKMVAKLIAGRNPDTRRQIFFVSMGGFDAHQSQADDQAALLGNVDKSLASFRAAIKAVQNTLWDDVVLFTNSDFARTLEPNGVDDTAGSDHAWGGHQIVLGGKVKGGKIYGTFPNLQPGGSDDVDDNTGVPARGRWIPKHSSEQYMGVVAKWFMSSGDQNLVQSDVIQKVFPNLYVSGGQDIPPSPEPQTIQSNVGALRFLNPAEAT